MSRVRLFGVVRIEPLVHRGLILEVKVDSRYDKAVETCTPEVCVPALPSDTSTVPQIMSENLAITVTPWQI